LTCLFFTQHRVWESGKDLTFAELDEHTLRLDEQKMVSWLCSSWTKKAGARHRYLIQMPTVFGYAGVFFGKRVSESVQRALLVVYYHSEKKLTRTGVLLQLFSM
jgi:hypothetical protein